MNLFTTLALILGLVAIALACGWLLKEARDHNLCLDNAAGDGTHAEGRITKKGDATVATRYLLCKEGTDGDHVDTCGADTLPLGVYTDKVTTIEDEVAIELLGIANRTLIVVASEAMTVGDDVYTAANGKVQDEPASAGTYYKIGRALTAASGDGQELVIAHHAPQKVIVLALMGNTNSEISALTSSATTTQAEFNALRDKCEELADDVRAIQTALQGGPALLKHLSA